MKLRLLIEANDEMKQVVHKAYNDCDGSKSKFIKLLMKRTGLTKQGLKGPDIQGYLDTLVFKRK